MVPTKTMEDLKTPVVMKVERPVRMYCFDTRREATATNMTKLQRNVLAKTDNNPILKDWEQTL